MNQQRDPEKKPRSRWFFKVRVTFLLLVLFGVLAWAGQDMLRRKRRTNWERPVTVGLVVLRAGPVDEDDVEELQERTDYLEERLAAEMQRHRPAATQVPFRFLHFGPIDVAAPPPQLTEDGIVALVAHNRALAGYLDEVDERVGLDTRGLGSRLYLVVRPSGGRKRLFVEGISQQGGWVGVVEVELAPEMIDFALFVATHELLHTLGAEDKYDAAGVRIPEGLAEPDSEPRFPQRFAEVMGRHRVVAPGHEEPPESLDELRIGKDTAREIGWLPPLH